MSTELYILALFGVVIIVNVLMQIVVAMTNQDIGYLVGPRDQEQPHSVVTGRLKRSIDNNVIALAYFAPAILIVHIGGLSTAGTVMAAQVFLAARIIYVMLYAMGVPWIRTFVWIVSLLATLYLYGTAIM